MDAFLFPPLDEGAVVVTDVMPSDATLDDILALSARLREMTDGPIDVVMVAVPAGEGVACELAIQRALRVEVASAEKQGPDV